MNTYSWSYKFLHWSMAVLIFLMFFAFQGFNPALTTDAYKEMLVGHSSIGTVISILLLLRLSKRFIFKHSQPQSSTNSKFKHIAKAVHYALYTLMMLVPMTGYLTANYHQLPVEAFGHFTISRSPDAELFKLLRNLHTFAIYSLIALLTLHISAAIGHKFIFRDQTMYKMRPWKN